MAHIISMVLSLALSKGPGHAAAKVKHFLATEPGLVGPACLLLPPDKAHALADDVRSEAELADQLMEALEAALEDAGAARVAMLPPPLQQQQQQQQQSHGSGMTQTETGQRLSIADKKVLSDAVFCELMHILKDHDGVKVAAIPGGFDKMRVPLTDLLQQAGTNLDFVGRSIKARLFKNNTDVTPAECCEQVVRQFRTFARTFKPHGRAGSGLKANPFSERLKQLRTVEQRLQRWSPAAANTAVASAVAAPGLPAAASGEPTPTAMPAAAAAAAAAGASSEPTGCGEGYTRRTLPEAETPEAGDMAMFGDATGSKKRRQGSPPKRAKDVPMPGDAAGSNKRKQGPCRRNITSQ